MIQNMKMAAKMALAFGIVIVLVGTVGVIAILNMLQIQSQSQMLSAEYVPEVRISNEIERNALLTMYDIRGYAFTGEDHYLTTGREYMGELDSALADAQSLAAQAEHLVALQGQADAAQTALSNYQDALDNTITENQTIAAIRAEMDAAAGAYIQACTA